MHFEEWEMSSVAGSKTRDFVHLSPSVKGAGLGLVAALLGLISGDSNQEG